MTANRERRRPPQISMLPLEELIKLGDQLTDQMLIDAREHTNQFGEEPDLVFVHPQTCLNLRQYFLNKYETFSITDVRSKETFVFGMELVSTLALNEGETKVYATQDLEAALKQTCLYGSTITVSRMHPRLNRIAASPDQTMPSAGLRFTRISIDLRLLEDYRTYTQMKANLIHNP